MATRLGIDEKKIEEIVARVLDRLGGGPTRAPAPRSAAVSGIEPPATAQPIHHARDDLFDLLLVDPRASADRHVQSFT